MGADVTGVGGSAGPPYTGWPGAALVAPSLVLTDGRGRQLTLNGTPCGFDGEGPCAACPHPCRGGTADRAGSPADDHEPTPADRAPRRTCTRAGGAARRDRARPRAAAALVGAAALREAFSAVDPRVPTDPHYPALAAAQDRVDAAGVDVEAALALAARDGQLSDANPGRALHFRLTSSCDAAVTPAPPPAPGGSAPAASTARPLAPGLRP